MLPYRPVKLTPNPNNQRLLNMTDQQRRPLLEAFTYEDYCKMFALDEILLQRKIIDFPGAFSSFNATAHQKDQSVVSLDGLYDLGTAMIENVVSQQKQIWINHVSQMSGTPDLFPIAQEKFAKFKLSSDLFLDDYTNGKEQQRYQAGDSESKLPFDDHSFQLALCSHWLFKQDFDLKQTIDFIDELCRVAGEVRIFPINNAKYEAPEFLGHLMANYQTRGFQISCIAIEFDKHETGSAMLSITSPHCAL
jgi:hypothetical protein